MADCVCLENRSPSRDRGFESYLFRQRKTQQSWVFFVQKREKSPMGSSLGFERLKGVLRSKTSNPVPGGQSYLFRQRKTQQSWVFFCSEEGQYPSTVSGDTCAVVLCEDTKCRAGMLQDLTKILYAILALEGQSSLPKQEKTSFSWVFFLL